MKKIFEKKHEYKSSIAFSRTHIDFPKHKGYVFCEIKNEVQFGNAKQMHEASLQIEDINQAKAIIKALTEEIARIEAGDGKIIVHENYGGC